MPYGETVDYLRTLTPFFEYECMPFLTVMLHIYKKLNEHKILFYHLSTSCKIVHGCDLLSNASSKKLESCTRETLTRC